MIERSNVLAVGRGGQNFTGSLLSAHRLIGACFHTTESDKRMRLLTRLYGSLLKLNVVMCHNYYEYLSPTDYQQKQNYNESINHSFTLSIITFPKQH